MESKADKREKADVDDLKRDLITIQHVIAGKAGTDRVIKNYTISTFDHINNKVSP